jgi:hypothetical protein
VRGRLEVGRWEFKKINDGSDIDRGREVNNVDNKDREEQRRRQLPATIATPTTRSDCDENIDADITLFGGKTMTTTRVNSKYITPPNLAQ